MRVELKKFGTMLISRQAGKEAFAALQPILSEIRAVENLEINFDGVVTFSPSWGDEFLMPLLNYFKERLILLPSDNPSVRITIALLEKTHNKKFH